LVDLRAGIPVIAGEEVGSRFIQALAGLFVARIDRAVVLIVAILGVLGDAFVLLIADVPLGTWVVVVADGARWQPRWDAAFPVDTLDRARTRGGVADDLVLTGAGPQKASVVGRAFVPVIAAPAQKRFVDDLSFDAKIFCARVLII